MASELLKVGLTSQVTDAERILINGVSGHTYTVLSIMICETAGNAETFDLYVDDGGAGSADYYIYKDQAIAAKATFEHTSKLVIEGLDHLSILASAGDLDVVVSYLDQTL